MGPEPMLPAIAESTVAELGLDATTWFLVLLLRVALVELVVLLTSLALWPAVQALGDPLLYAIRGLLT